MDPLPEAVLPEEKEPYERRLQEEREGSLHRESLGDDVPGEAGEGSPVSPELELQRYARNDPHDEGDREDLGPEPRGLVVYLIPVSHVDALEDENEQREPHREHREQVMVGNGERELQTGHHQRVFQNLPPEHCVITSHHPARVPMARTMTAALTSRFR